MGEMILRVFDIHLARTSAADHWEAVCYLGVKTGAWKTPAPLSINVTMELGHDSIVVPAHITRRRSGFPRQLP